MTLLPTNHPLGGGGFGLFGAPKFGKQRFPDFEPMPSPQMPQTAQPEKQDWMSGGKMTGRDAAGLALLAIGDAFGRKGSNNLGNMLQNRMAMQQHERMAAQQREQGWEDWRRQYDYQVANPKPTQNKPDAFTQTLINAGIDPQSEQGRAMYRDRAASMSRDPNDEIVTVSLPGIGVYSGPRSGLAEVMGGARPTKPVGGLTPLGGGAGGNVSGNFLNGL